MSDKHTEKTVNIDSLKDQDVLDELLSELGGEESVSKSSFARKNKKSRDTSTASGKRTARPLAEESANHEMKHAEPGNGSEKAAAAEEGFTDVKGPREPRMQRQVRRIIIPLILLAALVFFAFAYYRLLKTTSTLFLIPVAGAAVLSALFIILQIIRKRRVNIVGAVLSIILAVILVTGGCGLSYINGGLGQTMGQTADANHIVVIVRADDPAQSIEDAKDYVFGYENKTQPKAVEETIADIESKIGIFKRKKYKSVATAAKSLLKGKNDAVILNAVFIESLNDVYDGFSEKVRVIYTHDVALAHMEMAKAEKGQPFNVLISGIDTYGEIESVSRSDVNQIMTVNPKTKDILLVSTPRDYFVEIPGISNGAKDKLTHAGVYGIQATADTLGALYDTEINYYVRINFTSLIEVVDALGGIDVNSEVAFTTGNYSFVQGVNHLNGEQALAFSRARYPFESGDNQRGKNQQYVITAIINKMSTREALSHPKELFDSISRFVETNMEKDEFIALAADLLSSGETYTIERYQATGTNGMEETYSMPGQKLYVMYPDESNVEMLKEQIQLFMGE